VSRYKIINILDWCEILGEKELISKINDFSCPLNREIEQFVLNNALDFAKRKLSITYCVLNMNREIVGIFALAHKAIDIENSGFSNSKVKKLSRYATLDADNNSYKASAFLIAQFGKNYAVDDGHSLNGNGLMDLTKDVLKEVQHAIGGGIVYLECEEKPKLLEFYQNEQNGFIRFGERYSTEDNKKYIQLFKFL
jgi:hypothetical protein